MSKLVWLLFNCFIAMLSWQLNHSVFWCIVDWLFSPIVFLYWMFTHTLTLALIKATFAWFF